METSLRDKIEKELLGTRTLIFNGLSPDYQTYQMVPSSPRIQTQEWLTIFEAFEIQDIQFNGHYKLSNKMEKQNSFSFTVKGTNGVQKFTNFIDGALSGIVQKYEDANGRKISAGMFVEWLLNQYFSNAAWLESYKKSEGNDSVNNVERFFEFYLTGRVKQVLRNEFENLLTIQKVHAIKTRYGKSYQVEMEFSQVPQIIYVQALPKQKMKLQFEPEQLDGNGVEICAEWMKVMGSGMKQIGFYGEDFYAFVFMLKAFEDEVRRVYMQTKEGRLASKFGQGL